MKYKIFYPTSFKVVSFLIILVGFTLFFDKWTQGSDVGRVSRQGGIPDNKTLSDSGMVAFDTLSIGEIEIPPEPPKMEITIPPLKEGKLKRVVTNHAFGVGERLEFSVGYGVIKAGTAVMQIPEIVKFNGKKCYHIVSTAKSNKFFSVFFKVDDKVESFMDVHELYSHRFDKHLREGKFKADISTIFDQEKHLAIYKNSQDTFAVAEYVQDVLSAFYFIRTQDLKVGKSLFVDNHTDKKNYPLEVKVLRKERVKVSAGTFDCVVVEPILKASGIFKQKGSLTVWLTDDEIKMPVLMKSKVIVGSISTELINYRLGEVGKY
ncbi:MAG: DUF3108 domain-containing protein [candidate division Zixibacteria bacterium]|nr:DUF3108 domain-containing protein [candidate division Zixibacteria bacterium]